MRAAVLRDGVVTTRETADPTPGDGQILVRTRACAICASDLHFMDHPDADADDDTGLSKYDADANVVMGHEYCAEVVDYGPRTQRTIPIGTRVSSIPVLFTPGGVRVIGQHEEAPGGFSEYFLMSEAVTRVVPTELPDELVACADAISVGWSYAKRAAPSTNEVPLVIGCGAIGLATIATLAGMGVGPIVAVDFVESRRRTALEMGAHVVVDPAEVSPYARWREIAHGAPDAVKDIMNAVPMKGCVVFECVGVPGVLDGIIRSCERGTRIFSAGGPPTGEHLHTMTAKRKGLNIQFGGGPSVTHWDEAFHAVCTGEVDVRPMVGRLVGLDEMPQALDDARDARGPARIVLVPGR